MHVEEYNTSDREVLRFLFVTKDWADLYQLHITFGLTPGQVLDILERLVSANFAELDGIKARLTQRGREWVLDARERIFRSSQDAPWKLDKDDLVSRAREPLSPYLPDLSLVDVDFFMKLSLNRHSDNAKRPIMGDDSTQR